MILNEFLKKTASDIKVTNKVFSEEDFYYILKYIGVKKDVSKSKDIEKFYQNFLDNLDNSLVKYVTRKTKSLEDVTHYIGFYVDKKADCLQAVKVYFPVKYDYLISALKTTFLYLIRNNIKATVKFHIKATNEGIVIRFYDKKDVMPFISYCNNNFRLKDLTLNANPFIACIHGLGIVRDDNTVNSYNGTISKMLVEYFTLLKNSNTLDKASGIDFLDYLIKRINLEEDELVKFNIKAIESNVRAILNNENPL